MSGVKGKGGGNFSKAGFIQKDDEGNILLCPHCKSTHLIKSGTDGSILAGRPQRYKCKSCGRKSCNPIVSTQFELDSIHSESEFTTEELIEKRLEVFKRRERRENNEEFLDIKIKDNKPIGLFIMGDPHVDDNGCDWESILQHLELVNSTEGLYSINIGDIQNNWARRTKLEGLWAKQSTTDEEAWQLTEWLCHATNWILIVAGNHDMWSGTGDPLKWIMRPLKTTYANHSQRVRLILPKHKVRCNFAHNFQGNSIYNTAHSVVKHAIFHARDHLLCCGHKHISGYMPVKDANEGIVMHCLQIGSYKKYDDYAKQLNLPNKMMSPCAVAVINTKLNEKHGDFIKIFWDVQEGSNYLTWLRNEK